MLARINSYALNGLDGYGVTVEVDIHAGLPAFDVVGLPDAAVKESRERVRSAIKTAVTTFRRAKLPSISRPHTPKRKDLFSTLQ